MLSNAQIITHLLKKPLVEAFTAVIESNDSYDHKMLSRSVGIDLYDHIRVWLSQKDTLCYIALLERESNPHFNCSAFNGFYEAAGAESYSLPVSKAIEEANLRSVWIEGESLYLSKHLALDFACWFSPEFKLYFLKLVTGKAVS